MRTILLTLALAFSIAAGSASAEEFGSPEEARAMLEAAAAAVEADEAAALAAFTAGEAPFKDRDLYVFCAGPDGLLSAHGASTDLIGGDARAIVDADGKSFGAEMFEVAVAGEFNTVDYVWPRPGEDEPVPKSSYVTMAGDQMCAVGYYR